MKNLNDALRAIEAAARMKMAVCSGRIMTMAARLRMRMKDEKGQGTTEYAILVGILVVIAILAITVFRPKLQELWDAVASGINSL